jgi:phosphatidylglycerophosphatase A
MKLKAPKWTWLVATGMGSGLLRPASGTWGSLAGLGVWCLISRVILTPFVIWVKNYQSSLYLTFCIFIVELLIIIFIIISIWLAIFVSDLIVKETKEEDPCYIVIDEWVGIWIALWPIRWEIANSSHSLMAIGYWLPLLLVPFIAFRFLDIWKPWPIRQIQVLPHGYGIVVDDVVAGLCSMPVVILLTPFAMRIAQLIAKTL